MSTIRCGFCRSSNVHVEVYIEDKTSPENNLAAECCQGCGAYTFNSGVGPFPTEEEMATGWHRSGHDFVVGNPFSDIPYWTPATRAQMRLWALEVGAPK